MRQTANQETGHHGPEWERAAWAGHPGASPELTPRLRPGGWEEPAVQRAVRGRGECPGLREWPVFWGRKEK